MIQRIGEKYEISIYFIDNVSTVAEYRLSNTFWPIHVT